MDVGVLDEHKIPTQSILHSPTNHPSVFLPPSLSPSFLSLFCPLPLPSYLLSLLPLPPSISLSFPSFSLYPNPLKHKREAKKKQLRIWKGYTAPVVPEISAKTKNFSGKVVEIGNGDNLVVKAPDGEFQKIYFSSLRPPRSVECK